MFRLVLRIESKRIERWYGIEKRCRGEADILDEQLASKDVVLDKGL
jgi:hypothetical protein